ncbi:ribose ABC transporter ATPase [Lacticaseibacillus camelliae DSM 22697 = JCM 13995]|uniref:Ribose ABC transporter ATPase n=2 Tax=Lacticaseibacillus camelliae TaxID=381742 RepID=A0A0R2FA23_9LACO|nr:ribose ABC transporter ATPase [Lacticaseibacillus camelliae DSM 22697 = JCM 13995]
MIRETQSFVDQVGIKLNPTDMVRDLNASYKQITEIVRSLMRDAKVIIMDEPTTSLTDVEIGEIFEIMRTLRSHGVSIIFISHKLNEVLEICDSYTIMRDGVVVAAGEVTPTLTEAEISRHMVGKELSSSEIYRPRQIGDKVLELAHYTKDREFNDVTMSVRKGEVVGVTGLLGDGRSELFSTVVGADKPDSGQLLIDGKPVRIRTTSETRRYGIAYLPKNRKENGIIKDLDIAENMTLPMLDKISKMGLIDNKLMSKTVNHYIKQINIKVADPKDAIGSLSGGNQQKVLLAKALNMNPRVMILDNPTQGVDVGAKAEIYNQIMDLAEQGISFVILSSEIPEIQQLCDRVYIMFHGEVRAELPHAAINEQDVMLVATGGKLGGE